MQVEDFNEMFICEGCSSSKEKKKGIRELVGRDPAVVTAVPLMGDLLMGMRPGQRLSPGRSFAWQFVFFLI